MRHVPNDVIENLEKMERIFPDILRPIAFLELI